jgi:hypothetical protein
MAWKLLTKWFGGSTAAHERRLLDRCHGDQQLMERLIAHEQTRRPNLTRSAASRSAIERWNRDR